MTRAGWSTLLGAVLAASLTLPLAAQVAPPRFGRGMGAGAGGIPSLQQIQQMRQQTLALREAIKAFYDAKEANNDKIAAAASARTNELWSKVPDNLKGLIDMRHPGSSARVQRIISGKTETEAAPARPDDSGKGEGSLTITNDAETPATAPAADNGWIRDGNFLADGDKPAATQPASLWTKDGSKAPPVVVTAGAPAAKAAPARPRQYRDDLDLFGDSQTSAATQPAGNDPTNRNANGQNAQQPQQTGRPAWPSGAGRPGGFGGRRGR